MFVFLTFRGPLASHDSNPYPKRSRIARYNATKLGSWTFLLSTHTPRTFNSQEGVFNTPSWLGMLKEGGSVTPLVSTAHLGEEVEIHGCLPMCLEEGSQCSILHGGFHKRAHRSIGYAEHQVDWFVQMRCKRLSWCFGTRQKTSTYVHASRLNHCVFASYLYSTMRCSTMCFLVYIAKGKGWREMAKGCSDRGSDNAQTDTLTMASMRTRQREPLDKTGR